MSNCKMLELSRLLVEFVSTQAKLVETSQQHFVKLQYWERLSDFPRKGIISIHDEIWDFQKHGVGVCFIEQKSKIVVDIHEHFLFPFLFDAWRLETYLNSIKWKPVDKPTNASRSHQLKNIESLLHQMLVEGTLQRSSDFPNYFLLTSEVGVNARSLE